MLSIPIITKALRRNLDVFTVHSHGPPSAPITAQWSSRFLYNSIHFFWPIFIFLDIFNMSIPSGHQKPFPYVPSLVHVPIPVCHLYMIRLWISCTLKMLPTLIVKETATRRATQSSHLPTLRLPSPASTIQMLPTNSTTGTRGTIDMSIFNKISGIYISALFTYL